MNKQARGFSLIELAIVLVVVSLLIGYLILPLSVQKENRNILEARNQLKEIEEALYGFVIANGRLPCPTSPGLAGIEDGGGGADCNINVGFVPGATLGLNGSVNCDGLLIDAWNRPYKYSITPVDNGIVAGMDFVRGTQIRDDFFQSMPAPPATGINICTDGTCVVNVATNVVAVFYSTGNNMNMASPHQQENAENNGTASTCGLPNYFVSNDGNYVSMDRRDVVNQEYDDIVKWISPNILFSKMLSAGMLP